MSDTEYPACISELYQSEVLGEVVSGFLALYQQSDWLESMIRHEESFVHWVAKGTAGEEGSLDVAISQLQYPFPAP